MTRDHDSASEPDGDDVFALVGLTGNIASGKSTVADFFEDLGVPVLDADDLARAVVEPGEPAYEEIRQTFGERVLDEEGQLDRDRLGAIVFDDDEARSTLESITHPRIAARMQSRARELRESGHRWVIYDAALIVENDLHRGLEALVVVRADRETRRRRLMARDGLDRTEAEARLEAQMPQRDKLQVADYIIDNNGSLEETGRQVEQLHACLERGLEQYGTVNRSELEPHLDLPAHSFE